MSFKLDHREAFFTRPKQTPAVEESGFDSKHSYREPLKKDTPNSKTESLETAFLNGFPERVPIHSGTLRTFQGPFKRLTQLNGLSNTFTENT